MNTLKYLVTFIFIFGLFFLGFAFVEMDLNAANWEQHARAALVIFGSLGSLLVVSILYHKD